MMVKRNRVTGITASPAMTLLACATMLMLGAGQAAAQEDVTTISDLPAGGGSGPGDLSFSYLCENVLTHYHPDIFIVLYQRVEARVDGLLVAAAENSGYNELYTAVEFHVAASPANRQITCTSMTGSSDSALLEGSGPPVLTFLVGAYIPHEYVWQPWDPFNPTFWGLTLVDGGDNRWYPQYAGATARASTIFALRNPAYYAELYETRPASATGLTQAYDADTSLSFPQGLDWTGAPSGGYLYQVAKDDWQVLAPLKVAWATAHTRDMGCTEPDRLYRQFGDETSSVRLECAAWAYHPLHTVAPPIRWELSLRFTFGNNRIRYAIEGCTTYFPAFEAFANANNVLDVAAGSHPVQLVAGCNRRLATATGEVW